MLKIQNLESPHPFAANCYLISSCGEYAIIDPTAPYDSSLIDGEVKYILLTHAHFDHILEVDSWVNNTDAVVIISADEADALSDPMRNCYKLFDGTDRGYFGERRGINEGESIPLGDQSIEMIATPGHTIGSACYRIGNDIFVGDTVFAGGGFGRYDLPTGNIVMLRNSIRKILALSDECILYPGHGERTTAKEYKSYYSR